MGNYQRRVFLKKAGLALVTNLISQNSFISSINIAAESFSQTDINPNPYETYTIVVCDKDFNGLIVNFCASETPSPTVVNFFSQSVVKAVMGNNSIKAPFFLNNELYSKLINNSFEYIEEEVYQIVAEYMVETVKVKAKLALPSIINNVQSKISSEEFLYAKISTGSILNENELHHITTNALTEKNISKLITLAEYLFQNDRYLMALKFYTQAFIKLSKQKYPPIILERLAFCHYFSQDPLLSNHYCLMHVKNSMEKASKSNKKNNFRTLAADGEICEIASNEIYELMASNYFSMGKYLDAFSILSSFDQCNYICPNIHLWLLYNYGHSSKIAFAHAKYYLRYYESGEVSFELVFLIFNWYTKGRKEPNFVLLPKIID